MASRELKVEIIGDASSLEKAFGRGSRAGSNLGRSLRSLGKIAAVGVGAAFAGMAVVVKQGFDELSEGQQVAAQTAAALKSTGSAANVTAKDVETLAGSISRLTGIDDEAVQASENMLLTFTSVRNELGKGNDVFNQATVAIADMATRMNDGAVPSMEQLSQTSIRVGKALNDPIKGMGALSRVGVQFTAAQEKQIKAMVKAGDTMGAQKLILAELTKEFGGSAKAAGETLPGQLAKLRNSFDETAAKVATHFVPLLIGGLELVNKALEGASKFVDGFFKKWDQAEGVRGKMGVIVDSVKDLAGRVGQAIRDAGIGEKVAAAVAAINWNEVGRNLINGIIAAIEGTGELAKVVADKVTQAIRQINWEQVGAVMGPGLAAAVVAAFATLTDVTFWIRNWELAIAVFAVAFGGVIGKVASKLAVPLAKVGEDLILAIGVGLERALPSLGRLFVAGLLQLPKLAVAPFRALESLVQAVFGRLGKLAVFTIKILGLAAAISQLGQWASQVAGILAGVATDAFNFARRIGEAIIDGILDGLSGLAGRVRDTIIGGVQSAIDGAMGVFGFSPQEVIGVALIDGIIRGWNEKSGNLKSEIIDKVNETIDAAQAAIVARQGTFGSAFDTLVSSALSAFDRLSSEIETKTEAKIRKQDERRAAADRRRALSEAGVQLSTAIAGGDPEEIKRAEQAVADARFAIQRAADERKAVQERAQLEASRDRRRVNFENQLESLRQNYLQQHLSTKQFHEKLIDLFKKFEVPLGKAARTLGASLAQGLNESFADVQKAAKALAQEILDQFSRIKVIINVDLSVKGGTPPKKRQHGGPVLKNMPYIVGEAGPELFIPGTSGRVNPSSTATGTMAGGLVVNVYNAGSVISERDLVETVYNGLLGRQRRIGGLGFN